MNTEQDRIAFEIWYISSLHLVIENICKYVYKCTL